MKRIFHMSNRVDIPKQGPTAGGLDEAICQAPDGYTIVRFGCSEDDIVPDHAEETVSVTEQNGVMYITVGLKKSDYAAYYAGISNGYLWPLFHSRADIAQAGFNSKDIEKYLGVNKKLAEIAQRYIKPDDTVIVHDYHLMPMAQQLDIDNPMGFFLHIPVPSVDLIQQLDRGQQKFIYSLFNALHDFDFVGVQSKHDLLNMTSIVGNRPVKVSPDYFDMLPIRTDINRRGTMTQYGAFPVAGHIDQYIAQAKENVQNQEVLDFIQNHTPNGQVDIMSVERLDPSKGLVAKVRGCGRFLQQSGAQGENLHLLQIAPFGRKETQAYQIEKERVVTSIGNLNEIFAGTYANLFMDKVSRPIHLGVARHSNMGLVSSLRDGFNLYALEYLAAQVGRDNPGMMIASKYMGVSEVYGDCLVTIDPRQTDDIANAIRHVRQMSLSEKLDKMGQFEELNTFHTNGRWLTSLINATESSSTNHARYHSALKLIRP